MFEDTWGEWVERATGNGLSLFPERLQTLSQLATAGGALDQVGGAMDIADAQAKWCQYLVDRGDPAQALRLRAASTGEAA